MSDPAKTVFISYRRALNHYVARAIFMDLRTHGYDVFMDVESLDSGTFDTIILHQIEARAHFLVVLTPGSLTRVNERGDWLRREIIHAIDLQRNIVPLLAMGFRFENDGAKLPGQLGQLKRYNGLEVPDSYFDEAMTKLRERFLKKPTSVAVTPPPVSELSAVRSRIEKVLRAEPDLTSWKLALAAPTLVLTSTALGRVWKWTSAIGASGYVLQKSANSAFFIALEELYNGDKMEFCEFPGLYSLGLTTEYYRVKAKGGLFSLDSPWSNVVKIEPSPQTPLGAPKLAMESDTWKWTPVIGASGYILQQSIGSAFLNPKELYNGDKTEFFDFLCHFSSFYYRVKAKGGLFSLDSPWSNVVNVKAKGGLFSLDSPWSNVVNVKAKGGAFLPR